MSPGSTGLLNPSIQQVDWRLKQWQLRPELGIYFLYNIMSWEGSTHDCHYCHIQWIGRWSWLLILFLKYEKKTPVRNILWFPRAQAKHFPNPFLSKSHSQKPEHASLTIVNDEDKQQIVTLETRTSKYLTFCFKIDKEINDRLSKYLANYASISRSINRQIQSEILTSRHWRAKSRDVYMWLSACLKRLITAHSSTRALQSYLKSNIWYTITQSCQP